MSSNRPHAFSESYSPHGNRNTTTYSPSSPLTERRPSEIGLVTGTTSARKSSTDAIVTNLEINVRLPSILIRRLPRSAGHESLTTMLLFATDLQAVDFIDSTPEDAGFATAIAQFRTFESAREAQERLNNKPNASKDANMIVEAFAEVLANSSLGRRLTMRRNILDNTLSRQTTSSASSGGSRSEGLSRQSSRYNKAFSPADEAAPTNITPTHPDFPAPESNPRFDNLFSPRSPVSNRITDRPQNSGKAFINDDGADEETGELLKDPLAYARNDQRKGYQYSQAATMQENVAQLGNLSLNTSYHHHNNNSNVNSTNPSNLSSPLPTPLSSNPASRNAAFRTSPQKLSFPPANPADQNPPCNTLYVGNLALDTNEDELKRLFSQQRGYKRLCFRMKQNGPMCFVEFENITFATQALSMLYGTMLSNSVKGGIRLSFSKNPLGVRSGQSAMPGASPHAPPGMAGYGNGLTPPPGFPSSGPPPSGYMEMGRHTGYSPQGFSPSGMPDGPPAGYDGSYFEGAYPPFSSQMQMHPGGPSYMSQQHAPYSGPGAGPRHNGYGPR